MEKKPEPIPEGEKGARLAECIRLADEAYDHLYDIRPPGGAYSDMKDFMIEAIGLARDLGLVEREKELEKTLEHRKEVYRRQLS